MFRGGLTGVQEQTKAKPGDKTMMDALVPAVEAIEACESDDVKTLLKAGAEAALKGAEATVDMKANFGRARNLGKRSIGFADAGATSWACLFQSFARESIKIQSRFNIFYTLKLLIIIYYGRFRRDIRK